MRILITTILLLSTYSWLSICCADNQVCKLDSKINQAIDSYTLQHPSVGISIAYFDKCSGMTRFINWGYLSNDKKQVAVNNNTLFEIGSLTKLFTSILVAELILEEKISLEDPIEKYFPEIKVPSFNGGKILVKHLLAHSSGLPKFEQLEIQDKQDPLATVSETNGLNFLQNYQLKSKPGSQYSYSNFGFAILGLILERIRGEDFASIVATRLLQPLELTNTYLQVPSNKYSQFAIGHKNYKSVPHWHMAKFYHPVGGLHSSTADMIKFLRYYTNPNSSPSSLRNSILLTQKILFGNNQNGIAFSATVSDGYYSHQGQTGGFSCMLIARPTKDNIPMGLVILTNSRTSVYELAEYIRQLIVK